jgi:hypothetical protein
VNPENQLIIIIIILRVFENRVLRRIFGPKRDEVTGGWRKLNNEELHGLYSSPSIVRVIKARRMRWAGHVAQGVGEGCAYNIMVGRPEGRNHWEDLGIDGRTLRWILGKWGLGMWIGFIWLRIGTGGGLL